RVVAASSRSGLVALRLVVVVWLVEQREVRGLRVPRLLLLVEEALPLLRFLLEPGLLLLLRDLARGLLELLPHRVLAARDPIERDVLLRLVDAHAIEARPDVLEAVAAQDDVGEVALLHVLVLEVRVRLVLVRGVIRPLVLGALHEEVLLEELEGL